MSDVNIRLNGLLQLLENPKFNKKNSHFGNKYADLEGILEQVKPPILASGFRIFQTLRDGNWLSALVDAETNETILVVTIPFIVGKETPQAVGSALTYYRRYGILLLLNLVGEEDDDAEKAEGRGANKPSAKRRTIPNVQEQTTEKQAENW
jgi:hypothetical protein